MQDPHDIARDALKAATAHGLQRLRWYVVEALVANGVDRSRAGEIATEVITEARGK